ncbi:DUF7453 family protein [Iningainema tapete]|uniref:Uncharacterized protein n=1 Tax=Iningainema tapete BLCC-T55 TaxID=2748662 RepID=A0A8J7CA90_9CYAN|nr:choice-of-anchor tandem repeat NxxGxxAF-containing protein [Iningainema tapete]MBD2776866.1 hypothetical protein [Iningainema tapete BLCC-T55]
MKTLSNNSVMYDKIHNHTTVSCPPHYASLRTKKSLRWMSRLSQGLAYAICLSLVATGKAMAGNFSLTKIADSIDFSQINITTAMNDSGSVVFIATPLVGARGVYTGNGEQIVKIIDENQLPDLLSKITEAAPIPFPAYLFNSLVDINNNGTVAFSARKTSRSGGGEVSGIFISKDGSFTTRATAISSGGIANAFTNIIGFALNNQDELAYLTKSSARLNPETYRLFLNRPNQANITIADAGDYRFSTLENPLYQINSFALNDLGRVTFSATKFQQIFPPGLPETQRAFIPSSQQAIFTGTGTGLTTLIERGASALDANDENVILSTSDGIQLFNYASGNLRTIVDNNGSFQRLGSPAINNQGNIAFTATINNGERGIFTGTNPITDKVIATGDPLAGSTVINLNFLKSGFNNNGEIAFFAQLANGTTSIYSAKPVAEAPPPQPVSPVEDTFKRSRIVDTKTPIPNGTGNFINIDSFFIQGDNVVFSGSGSDGQRGIYNSDRSTISTIVDLNTIIPGSSGTFSSFDTTPQVENGNVVFSGSGTQGNSGIYIKRGDASLSVIADTNTAIPNGSGNFARVDVYSLKQNNVAFRGFDSNGQQGIYINREGTLQLVVDNHTPIPGGTGNFSNFDDIFDSNFDGNNVAFQGSDASGQQGIYVNRNGTLQLVVDSKTPIPDGTGNFANFSSYFLKGNNVVFEGYASSEQRGIYIKRDEAPLSVVVDNKTQIPGGIGNFSSFSTSAVSENNVVFLGNGLNGGSFSQLQGIYINRDSALQVVVDKNTPIPGGVGNFDNFNFLKIEGDNVFFVGFGSNGQRGIYVKRNGQLQVVVDKTNTSFPSSKGKFSDFSNPVVERETLAFLGFLDSTAIGIYANVSGSLLKVADLGDRLDGARISSLNLDTIKLSGTSLTFRASLIDGTQALVRADLITDTPKLIP